jgi:hypothetical protein
VGFSLSSARSSADAYSLDVKTGKVERWTFSETGGLNTADFPEPELIHWKSWDGRAISGFLYKPPANFSLASGLSLSIFMAGLKRSFGRVFLVVGITT